MEEQENSQVNKVVEEIDIQEKIEQYLDKHNISYTFVVATRCFSQDNSSYIVSMSLLSPEDLDSLLKLINYDCLCDKSNIIINKKNNVIIFGECFLPLFLIFLNEEN